jgi:hypothetical protein
MVSRSNQSTRFRALSLAFQNPKPILWTANAAHILEKVTRAQATLNQ